MASNVSRLIAQCIERGQSRDKAATLARALLGRLSMAESEDTLPRGFSDLVAAIMSAADRSGADEDSATAQALVAAHNAGWQFADGVVSLSSPRVKTFAENVTARGTGSTYAMRDVELLKPGTWRDGRSGKPIPVTDELVSALANNTNALHERLQPMVTLGHVDDKQAADMRQHGPAHGWIGNLYIDKAGSLRAKSISGIPHETAVAIENGGYKRLSVDADLAYEPDVGGARVPVIKRVALVGATKPMVDTMENLPALYGEAVDWKIAAAEARDSLPITIVAVSDTEDEMKEQTPVAPAIVATPATSVEEIVVRGAEVTPDTKIEEAPKADAPPEEPKKETEDPTPDGPAVAAPAVTPAVSSLEDALALINTLTARATKAEADSAALKATVADVGKTSRKQAALALFEQAKSDRKITPAYESAMREFLVTLSEIDESKTTVSFAEGARTVTASPLAAMQYILEKLPPQFSFGESAPVLDATGTSGSKVALSEESRRTLRGMGYDPDQIQKLKADLKDGSAPFAINGDIDKVLPS